MGNTGFYLLKFTNAIMSHLKEMSGYSVIYQDFFSCFLTGIMKTNSPRWITHHNQTTLKEKNEARELENELLGYLGPESRTNQCELESQDVGAFSAYEMQVTYSGYCSCVHFKILNCYETQLKNNPWQRYQKTTASSSLSNWVSIRDLQLFSLSAV